MIEKLKSKGELYRQTQILMAHSSLRLDGQRISKEEVEALYDQGGDEFIEKHSRLFDYMLETYEQPITKDMIVNYYKVLGQDGKFRTSETTRDIVAGVTPAEEIPKALDDLISMDRGKFSQIVEFVALFEKVRPFEKYSGVIGRMLAYKECLRIGTDPLVVMVGHKSSPYWVQANNPKKYLRAMQDCRRKYIKMIEPLL